MLIFKLYHASHNDDSNKSRVVMVRFVLTP